MVLRWQSSGGATEIPRDVQGEEKDPRSVGGLAMEMRVDGGGFGRMCILLNTRGQA